jgi:Leucine-rich repeat (LRR) protein
LSFVLLLSNVYLIAQPHLLTHPDNAALAAVKDHINTWEEEFREAMHAYPDSIFIYPSSYGSNLAAKSIDGVIKYGFIDRQKKMLTDFAYDNLLPFTSDADFTSGFCNGRNYIIDRKLKGYVFSRNGAPIEIDEAVDALILGRITDSLACENWKNFYPNLKILFLYLPIEVPCIEQIVRLENLEILQLNNCTLEYLPPSFGNLVQLRSLRITGSNLTNLPASFTELRGLKELILQRNKFTALPPEILELQQLESLVVEFTPLIAIPTGIGNLINLRKLHFNHCNIQRLPAELAKLKKLTDLQLFYNKGLELAEELRQLTELNTLYLTGIELPEYPPQLNSLVNLSNLGLNGNQIGTLPDSFFLLNKLASVNLSSSGLETLPSDFWKMPNLKHIQLNQNRFTAFPLEALENPGIESISFYGNKIRELPAELLSNADVRVSMGKNPVEVYPDSSVQINNLNMVYQIQQHVLYPITRWRSEHHTLPRLYFAKKLIFKLIETKPSSSYEQNLANIYDGLIHLHLREGQLAAAEHIFQEKQREIGLKSSIEEGLFHLLNGDLETAWSCYSRYCRYKSSYIDREIIQHGNVVFEHENFQSHQSAFYEMTERLKARCK